MISHVYTEVQSSVSETVCTYIIKVEDRGREVSETKMTVFSVVAPCSLVEIDRRFRVCTTSIITAMAEDSSSYFPLLEPDISRVCTKL
jgi:hypothetical protein